MGKEGRSGREASLALRLGAGGVGLRAGVPAAAVSRLFVWSSLGRRLEVGEAAPHLVAPPEGLVVEAPASLMIEGWA